MSSQIQAAAAADFEVLAAEAEAEAEAFEEVLSEPRPNGHYKLSRLTPEQRAIITELAALGPFEYAAKRQAVAKEHGLSLRALDGLVDAAQDTDADDDDRKAMANLLIEIVKNAATLFHDAEDNGYADITVN